jgi:hypothetical protein
MQPLQPVKYLVEIGDRGRPEIIFAVSDADALTKVRDIVRASKLDSDEIKIALYKRIN